MPQVTLPLTSPFTVMDANEVAPLTKCPTCGAESDEDLSKAWPGPRFLPRSPLVDWHVDWNSEELPALDGCCVVCATVVSVYFNARRDYRFRTKPALTRLLYRVAESGRYLLGLHSVYVPPYHGCVIFQPFLNTPLSEQYEPCDKFIRSSSSPEAFELARRWLDTCRKHHQKCSIAPESFIPTRLVDIGPGVRDENPRLVLRSEVRDDVRFVALSHCWGDSQPLKTEKRNIESHMAGILLGDLPATFKDAMEVTRVLGLRYIWIDSLCIIQDDRADWEQEAAQMDKVYGNAELVLAASSAAGACDGFLRGRDQADHHVGVASFTLDTKLGPVESKYRLVTERAHTEIMPLDDRGWAFQERLLARRYLAYNRHEMQWECREGAFCECTWTFTSPAGWWWKYDLASTIEEGTPSQLMSFWREDVLQGYVTKKLTVRSDKLVALSAIASRFQRKCGDTYLAGLWEKDLVNGLLWYTEGDMPEAFYAPSWSWVSVQSPAIEFYMGSQGGTTTLVDIVEASTTPSTSNPFGPVSSGLIKLRGKIIDATCWFVNGRGWRVEVGKKHEGTRRHRTWLDMPLVAYPIMDYATARKETSARRMYHTEGEPLGSTLTCTIWLFPLIFEKDRGFLHTLMLGPSPKHRGCFERLGYVQCYTEDIEDLLAETQTRVISLV